MKNPTDFILVYSNGKAFPVGHKHHINHSTMLLDIKFLDEQVKHVNSLSHLNTIAIWKIYPKEKQHINNSEEFKGFM